MARSLAVILGRDLPDKGITWSRQHIHRKIKTGQFPPPDGKTGDSPTAPNFWFTTTIDRYLRSRARALAAARQPLEHKSSGATGLLTIENSATPRPKPRGRHGSS